MKRIGVLIPPANARCETEYPSVLPQGFTAHFTRLVRPEATLTEASLIAMKESALDAADRLSWIQPVALAYACTSGSFLGGSDARDAIANQLHERTGVPAVTTASAVVGALKALSVRKAGVITPYPPAITAGAIELLSVNGVSVAEVSSYGYELSRDILAISPESVAARVRTMVARCPELDGVFISCTNVGTFTVIEDLEQELGIPVLSSNSATLNAVLRLAGYEGSIAGIGKIGQSSTSVA